MVRNASSATRSTFICGGPSLLMFFAAPPISPTPKPPGPRPRGAKYVCVPEVGGGATIVAAPKAGVWYRTVINVHNPNGTPVQILKKAAAALSERSGNPGTIGKPVSVVLQPDQVLMIDCTDIRAL